MGWGAEGSASDSLSSSVLETGFTRTPLGLFGDVKYRGLLVDWKT